jgi:hypothetical protein
MNEEDRYRVRVVTEDLEFIRDEWRESIPESALRRSSNVLRTLLVHGELAKAWRSLGFEKQPVVSAPDLLSIIRDRPRPRIELAIAGGAHYKGMQVMAVIQGSYRLSPEEFAESSRRGPYADHRDFPLSKLLESPCLIFRGSTINRRELIHYIANKLGGTHLDMSRDDEKDLDRRLKEIDYLQGAFQVLDLPPTYFELLSLGQSLVASPDIQKLIQAGRQFG